MDLKIISDYKQSKKVLYMKSFISKNMLPSWDNFLNHMDNRIKIPNKGTNSFVYEVGGEVINKVNFWDRVSMSFNDATEDFYPYITEIRNAFELLHPNKEIASGVYITLTSKESDYEHFDEVDVFQLQCIGKSLWKIKDSNGSISEYILSPGDVIFVPSMIIHEVVPLSPRAAISFMFKA